MVIWAVVQSRIANEPTGAEREVITYLIQGLNLDKVGSIVVGTGDDALRLKRVGNHFVVASKDDYPAQTKLVNDLITKVLGIKTREMVTSNPENYAELGVTEDRASSVVKFLNREGKVITGVFVGNRMGLGSSYARLATADDVFIAGDIPLIQNSAMDYIEQQVLQVDEDDIRSVTVADANGSYTLRSEPNSTQIALENIPQGKRLKDSNCREVFSALTNLRLQDVRKASAISKDLSFDHSYICRLEDSTVYRLDVGKSDGQTFIKCRAEFTDTEEIVKERRVESEEQLKKKEAKLLARDAAEQFNRAHRGWVYEIADWKAKALAKRLSELLEDEQTGDTSLRSDNEEQ